MKWLEVLARKLRGTPRGTELQNYVAELRDGDRINGRAIEAYCSRIADHEVRAAAGVALLSLHLAGRLGDRVDESFRKTGIIKSVPSFDVVVFEAAACAHFYLQQMRSRELQESESWDEEDEGEDPYLRCLFSSMLVTEGILEAQTAFTLPEHFFSHRVSAYLLQVKIKTGQGFVDRLTGLIVAGLVEGRPASGKAMPAAADLSPIPIFLAVTPWATTMLAAMEGPCKEIFKHRADF